jgi:protein-ribulosamine 3-kinase
MQDHDQAAIAERISRDLRVKCSPAPERTVGGGSINTCYLWRTSRESLFVKVADAQSRDMLEAEAAGLSELAQAQAVRVPQVRLMDIAGRYAFLALEWIEHGSLKHGADARLGEQLAQLHRVTDARFGWHRDNTIGLTPQQNTWDDSWPHFFRERRLKFQLQLAIQNGHGAELEDAGHRLLERLDVFFTAYQPAASLLHGDLWGGNWLIGHQGEPVIFDPACYYGDREADLAMTHLFGGFDRSFYSAYEGAWPLDTGHRARRDLYNLYHVINHANLFGGGYVRQAKDIIHRLLAQAGG